MALAVKRTRSGMQKRTGRRSVGRARSSGGAVGKSLTTLDTLVHPFARSVYTRSDIGSSALIDVIYGSKQFNFAPSIFDDFTTLFDQYRIEEVSVTFSPRFNVTDSFTQLTQTPCALPTLMWVVDHDDASVPGSFQTLTEYANVKVLSLDRPRTVTFKPHCATSLYQSGVVSAGYGQSAANTWVDMNSRNVQHYGLKYAIDLKNTVWGSNFFVDTTVRYKFSCKGVR